MERKLTYTQAINEAMHVAMEKDPTVLCMGLGVDDPKRIFGTTAGLKELYPDRVLDMPTSENAMTGISVGAAIRGMHPVVVHQRIDFFLLAMDQLVNSAAKWRYMFGGQNSVPMTTRLIVGHGWGQGPTHSQNLHAWFAHIPGLKVIQPTTPYDAKGMLLSSIFDEDPVVMIEHRWLHNTEGSVPYGDYRVPIGPARMAREGKDVTLVALSYMVVEALEAADHLAKHGIEAEVIDLRSVQPIDWKTVEASVKKTGRLAAIDTAAEICSVASEVVARVSENLFQDLKSAPIKIAQPQYPSPSSPALTLGYYKRAEDIIKSVAKMFGKEINLDSFMEHRKKTPHDVPGEWFKGPF